MTLADHKEDRQELEARRCATLEMSRHIFVFGFNNPNCDRCGRLFSDDVHKVEWDDILRRKAEREARK